MLLEALGRPHSPNLGYPWLVMVRASFLLLWLQWNWDSLSRSPFVAGQ